MGLSEDGLEAACSQLLSLMSCKALPFIEANRVVNSADSGYALPKYIYPLVSKCGNLNLVIRLRAGMKVYLPYEGEQKGKGRKKAYAEIPYYLQLENQRRVFNPHTKSYQIKVQTPIFDLECDETLEFESQTRRGREIVFVLKRWNNLLLRGSKEYKMCDHPFDLVAITCVDKQTGEMLFNRPMFLSFWGSDRSSYSCKEIHKDYLHRYDIEVHNRFIKQSLLMDKYQTPKVEHLDAWMWIVQLTHWLLYAASEEVELYVNEWEKYLPEVKRATESKAPKSAAMTRRGAKALFSTFDLTPFKPKSIKNGKGRKTGQKQTLRAWQPPQKKTKIKLRTEKLE